MHEARDTLLAEYLGRVYGAGMSISQSQKWNISLSGHSADSLNRKFSPIIWVDVCASFLVIRPVGQQRNCPWHKIVYWIPNLRMP